MIQQQYQQNDPASSTQAKDKAGSKKPEQIKRT